MVKSLEPPEGKPRLKHSSFLPEELSASQIYDIMAGFIVPRPIALVSTLDQEGRPNLAPFSYFMPGGINPPGLALCTVRVKEGKVKDTGTNIEATGEFVVNLVHRDMALGMNETAAGLPRGESEWPSSGFTPLPSLKLKPDRVAESLVQFECRLFDTVSQGTESGAGMFIIGTIVAMHVSDELMESGIPQPLQTIARLGGSDYLDLDGGKVFELPRPGSAPKTS